MSAWSAQWWGASACILGTQGVTPLASAKLCILLIICPLCADMLQPCRSSEAPAAVLTGFVYSSLDGGLAAGDVIEVAKEPGLACTLAELEDLLQLHKPTVLFICQGGARAWHTVILRPVSPAFTTAMVLWCFKHLMLRWS